MSDATPIASASRRTRAITAGIALAAFLIGSILATWAINHFRAAQPAPVTTSAPEVAPAAQRVAVAPPASTDAASLTARQEMLSAQLDALEQRTSAVTGEAASAYGNATRAEALLVAFATRRVLDRGLALGYLEQQLRDRFGATQPHEVATIVQAARAPVTIEDLRLGLDQIGPQLAMGPAKDGWGGALWRMLNSLIVVHPRKMPSPVPGERLARVRRLLSQGQVEAAVEEVGKMPGANQATGWMTGARQYVAVRKALDTLEAAALEGRTANPAPATASAKR